MASVYGDILVHFPELVLRLPYFSQEPKIGAGYERSDDTQYVECVRQTGAGRRISGSTRVDFSAISPVLKVIDNFVIWTDIRLKVGYFMISDEEVYRISAEKDWTLEAGFYSYVLEKVVGNNGNTEEALPVKVGDF